MTPPSSKTPSDSPLPPPKGPPSAPSTAPHSPFLTALTSKGFSPNFARSLLRT
ncbi:unnamed protein product, partial [Gulo gulo]